MREWECLECDQIGQNQGGHRGGTAPYGRIDVVWNDFVAVHRQQRAATVRSSGDSISVATISFIFIANRQKSSPKTRVDAETLRLIRDAYRDCQGNVTAISSRLKDNHRIPLSRTRIARVLDDLGLPRLTRGRG